MLGRDSRLHAWTVAHPLRFGFAGGALVAVAVTIANLPWAQGVVRGLAVAVAVGGVSGAVFALMTKATP
jgi:hypothetical protein